jgi:hypothetical protein
MDAARRHGTGQGRRSERSDKKRDREDDDFDDFLERKMREARNYIKEDNDRLRADRKKDRQEIDRLRSDLRKKDAEIKRKDAELANLKQQWQEASERQTKRAKAALEKLVEVFAAPAKNEDGDSTDPSSDQGDGPCGEDPLRPTLPEAANTADGPGEAAPGPEEAEEDEDEAAKIQDEALERAAHSTRSEIPDMPQALGGQ